MGGGGGSYYHKTVTIWWCPVPRHPFVFLIVASSALQHQCCTISLSMESEFQNSHSCPEDTMKHLCIPWLELKVICRESSRPLLPCTSWIHEEVIRQLSLSRTHRLCHTSLPVPPPPMPLPCSLHGTAQTPTPSRRFPQARIYFAPSLPKLNGQENLLPMCFS